MKIYISSHSTRLAQELAGQLMDHEIVSVWHDGTAAPPLAAQHAWLAKCKVNQRCIEDADVFVLISTTLDNDGEIACVPGGKFFEAGYAYAIKKPMFVVGEPENGAFWSVGIVHVQSVDILIDRLNRNFG